MNSNVSYSEDPSTSNYQVRPELGLVRDLIPFVSYLELALDNSHGPKLDNETRENLTRSHAASKVPFIAMYAFEMLMRSRLYCSLSMTYW